MPRGLGKSSAVSHLAQHTCTALATIEVSRQLRILQRAPPTLCVDCKRASRSLHACAGAQAAPEKALFPFL